MSTSPPPAPTASAAAARLAEAALVMLDLDGCLIFGGRPHPAAAALLDRVRDRYVIVSNNSTETQESMAGLLAGIGLQVVPERILLAGAVMVDELRADDNPPTALFAAPRLVAYARDRGLALAVEGAAAPARVAIARHTTLSYASLNAALALLAAGLPLVVSNPDLTHPGANREPVIETGGLLALFQACLPHLRPRVVGKPEPLLFQTALSRFGVAPERAVMVGDNPLTDAAGAARAGIASILVGPAGEHESITGLL